MHPGYSLLPGLMILMVLLSGCIQSADQKTAEYSASPIPSAPSSVPTIPDEPPHPQAHLSGTWELQSYTDENGNQTPVSDTIIRISFGSDAQMTGFAGCNQYGSTYQVNNSHINLGPISITARTCDDKSIAAQEGEYLDQLSAVSEFSISDKGLELTPPTGGQRLIYYPEKKRETMAPEQTSNLSSSNLSKIARQTAPLTGTNWRLISIRGDEGTLQKIIPDTQISALFSFGGNLTGTAGCNQYTTHYTITGQEMNIQIPAGTRKSCASPEGLMKQEAAYLALLNETGTFRTTPDQLFINDKGGSVILMFRTDTAGQASDQNTKVISEGSDLTDTTWMVRTLQDQNGNVITPVGSQIDLIFERDSTVQGSMGCDTYAGRYTISGSSIKISGIAVTNACTSAAGSSDQGAQFIADLKDAARYDVKGGILTLRRMNGQVLITGMSSGRLER